MQQNPNYDSVSSLGDFDTRNITGDERDKRKWRIQRTVMALIEISVGGCYGLSAVLFYLSEQWQIVNGNNPFLTDPYYGPAEALAAVGVIVTISYLLIYAYKTLS